ncbi:MAG: hypothetical protein KGV51_01155 [Moraxellaceae bacterium]|nr:hypothetical protein [Moraxellaceae bacterium]
MNKLTIPFVIFSAIFVLTLTGCNEEYEEANNELTATFERVFFDNYSDDKRETQHKVVMEFCSALFNRDKDIYRCEVNVRAELQGISPTENDFSIIHGDLREERNADINFRANGINFRAKMYTVFDDIKIKDLCVSTNDNPEEMFFAKDDKQKCDF